MAKRLTLALLPLALALGCAAPPADKGFWPVTETLRAGTFVDLTHAFAPGVPRGMGFPDLTVQDVNTYSADGFRAQKYCLVGQYGTHCDAPVHFHRGMATIDEIPVEEMIAPLVVIDISDRVERFSDYSLSVEDVKQWEAVHGPIPAGAFVALRTDWSKRWPSQTRMLNLDADGVAHCPGWSLEALQYLYETRRITATGHETINADPGVATSAGDYSCESYVLGLGRFQIEMLCNLDRAPPTGAMAVVTFPKPAGGSGFPARVFAVCPPAPQPKPEPDPKPVPAE